MAIPASLLPTWCRCCYVAVGSGCPPVLAPPGAPSAALEVLLERSSLLAMGGPNPQVLRWVLLPSCCSWEESTCWLPVMVDLRRGPRPSQVQGCTQLGLEGRLLPLVLPVGEIFTAVPCDKELIKAGGVMGIHSAGNDKSLSCRKGYLHQRDSYRLQRTDTESLYGCKAVHLCFCLRARESLNRTLFCGKEKLCVCL